MKWNFADFSLDTDRYELRRGGAVVPVEPQVFDVLEYLMANRNRVVLKDELIQRIWPHKEISEATLSSRVMAARRAIGDDGASQRFIKTLHGRGFMFVAEIDGPSTAAAEVPPQPALVAFGERPPPLTESLDAPSTSFFGRNAELQRLHELLARPGCRLVSIAGPGGMGKTRLAAVLVAQLHDAGMEIAVVKCRSLDDAADIPFALASALGITLVSEDPAAELAARIGGRPLMLVLDNVEQMAHAAAGVISVLLDGTSHLRIVVTTRQVLAVRGEWVFALGGLHCTDEPVGSAACQLFLDRETQALASLDPDRRGDPADAALTRICGLVDGMPLALELAAALRRYITRQEIADRIEGDANFLAANLSDVPDRHRRMTALLEESVERLSVEQARVLLSLSVFEASFGLEAAQFVAEATLRVLGELVDRSLLQSNEGRFSLHPLLRQFAREKLGPIAACPLRTSHSEYYARFLEQRASALEGHGQVAAVHEIHREFPNVESAWLHAADEGRLDLLAAAAYPLSLFVEIRTRNLEIIPYLDRAIAAARDRDVGLAAAVLVSRGWALFRTGRMALARASAEEAAAMFAMAAVHPPMGIGRDPSTLLAVLTWTRGNYEDALALAQGAESLADERSDLAGRAFAFWIQGAVLLRKTPLEWRGDADGPGTFHVIPDAEARANLGRAASALAAAREVLFASGERWLSALVETDTGLLAQATGDLRAALRHFDQALTLYGELGNRNGMAAVLLRLANVYLELGDPDRADQLLQQAEPLVTGLGEGALASDFAQGKASVAVARRDFPVTFRFLATCISLALEVGFNANVIAGLRQYAEAVEIQGEPGHAYRMYRAIAREPGMTGFSRARCETALRRLVAFSFSPGIEDARSLVERARSALLEMAEPTLPPNAPIDLVPRVSHRPVV